MSEISHFVRAGYTFDASEGDEMSVGDVSVQEGERDMHTRTARDMGQ